MRSISVSRVLISTFRPRVRLICFTANSSPVLSFSPLNTFDCFYQQRMRITTRSETFFEDIRVIGDF